MSYEHNVKAFRGGQNLTAMVSIAAPQTPTPSNCKTLCCYGYGRCFCFPCMAKILSEKKGK